MWLGREKCDRLEEGQSRISAKIEKGHQPFG